MLNIASNGDNIMGVIFRGKLGKNFQNFKVRLIRPAPIMIAGSNTLSGFSSTGLGKSLIQVRSNSSFSAFISSASAKAKITGTSSRTIEPFSSTSTGTAKFAYAFKSVDVLPTYTAGQSQTSAPTAENGSYAGTPANTGQQARIIGTTTSPTYTLDYLNGVYGSTALVKLPSLRVNGPNAPTGDFTKKTIFSCDISIPRKADASMVVGFRYIGALGDPGVPDGYPVGAVIAKLNDTTPYWVLRINQGSNVANVQIAPIVFNKKTTIKLTSVGKGVTVSIDGYEESYGWDYLNYTFTPLVQCWSYTDADNMVATVSSFTLNQ